MIVDLDFSQINWEEVSKSTIDTLRMLGASGLFTLLLGLPWA